MSTNKIISINALLIALLIGGFFFISLLLGFEENSKLRFLNLLFLLVGVHRAVKINIFKNKETNYFTNFGIGLKTGIIAVILSVLGVIIYAQVINPNFMEVLRNSSLIRGNLSIYEIIFTLMLEGVASSVIGSFIIMQFYKNHDKKIV